MTFEECRLLIPEYLSGQLTPAEKDSFEAQLETSAELSYRNGRVTRGLGGLGRFPKEAAKRGAAGALLSKAE